MVNKRPIGVFDSGVGGLTVLRALRAALPQEDFIYLGDMARLPYGTKSPETVARYAVQVAAHMLSYDIKMLVVACNTASAQGLEVLRETYPVLPCLGVIEAGAAAAVQATRNRKIVVLATEGTVASRAYQKAIHACAPQAEVEMVACNLLVSLVEEGWHDGPEAVAILRRYLSSIRMKDYDTVVLGCTHFPLIQPLLRTLLPEGVRLVDSATSIALQVTAFVEREGLASPLREGAGSVRFLVTDGPARFEAIARRLFPKDDLLETIEFVAL